MKHKQIIIYIILISVFSPCLRLFAEDVVKDQIMMADIPFVYGEADFIRRVNNRAGDHEPVGLVLSGGSARAFAHIGVLKRMEELGIVPDFIIANSMGSIVGLLYGAGFSPDQISEIILSTDIAALFKVVLPSEGGIIDVSRFSGLLHNYTGDLDLRDLPIPVMVLCEDLKTKRQVRIAEGDFLKIMQAAYALPVYFNPVEYGEHLLIDGGISNLVPLDAAYEYTNAVIASTAFYQNPKLNLKNPLTNINVALDVGKSRTGVSQIKAYNPLLIRCNVESFSFMEFGSLPEIQAAGYGSAGAVAAELTALDGSPVTEDLLAVREQHEVKIAEAVRKYRRLGSIPVLEPALLTSFGLDNYNIPRGERYLNTDFHFNGGLEFLCGYFSASASAGAGTDLADLSGTFPVFDANAGLDIAESVRLSFSYSLRLDPDGFADLTNPGDIFGTSDIYAGARVVPFASERLLFGFSGLAEASMAEVTILQKTLLTVQADISADSEPLSEENMAASLFAGIQVPNEADNFNFGSAAFFSDLEFQLPVPKTGGLFRLDGRGFIRNSFSGGDVNYYLRDGMRTSVESAEYPEVRFASASFVFNPFNFRPAVAEVFMFKEIELAAFGEIGSFEQMVWSSGLSLDFDLSLIGLKPTTLSSYVAWDSLSGGIIGGIALIP